MVVVGGWVLKVNLVISFGFGQAEQLIFKRKMNIYVTLKHNTTFLKNVGTLILLQQIRNFVMQWFGYNINIGLYTTRKSVIPYYSKHLKI